VKVRILSALTAAATVMAGASAQEPTKLKLKAAAPAAAPKVESSGDAGELVMNQSLADEIAKKLDGHPAMTGSDVQIFTSAGVVTLVGTVKGDKQKQDILDVVRYVKGVKQVRDGLKASAVKQTQGVGPLATPAPSGMPPMPMGGGAGGAGYGPDPVPVGPAGGPGGFEGAAPPLPPYAWPTYAPYNNVSRVAYPEAYPYNAFPFIGPFYPFPKVPLGWRKVTLEWEDGHWWLGRLQTPHDYWRTSFK
jgi:BON domain